MSEDQNDDGARHRAWVFTRNNYTEDCVTAVYAVSLQSSGGVCGKETGEECHTPHLQGCVIFDTLKSWEQVSAMLPHFWVKAKCKNARFDQTWNYCLKGAQPKEQWLDQGIEGPDYGKDADTFLWGECPADNRREDANARAARNMALCKKRKYGEMDASIVANQLRNYKFGAQHLREEEIKDQLVSLPGDRGTHHEWHYGPPGCGKSYYCRHAKTGAVYNHEAVDKWWDGYDYEPNVIFDDVDQSQASQVSRYKALLGQDPFRVQVKGGSMEIRPQCVMVTSNVHPNQVWGGVHLDAIMDRLGDRIYHWKESRYLISCHTGKYILDSRGHRCPNPLWSRPEAFGNSTPQDWGDVDTEYSDPLPRGSAESVM